MSKSNFSASRVHDLAGSVLGVFALVMLISSPWQVDTTGPDPFYKGPLIFPLIVFVLIVAGSLPSMLRLVRPLKDASWELDEDGLPFLNVVILGLLVLYLFGLLAIGLEASTWLFLMVSMKVVKQDTRLKIIFFPILMTLILYLVFKVFLDVWFPEPFIMTYIMDLLGE